MYSILIEVIVFVVTVVLAMIDSSDWPGAFFWITMITVVILNSEYRSGGKRCGCENFPVFTVYIKGRFRLIKN